MHNQKREARSKMRDPNVKVYSERMFDKRDFCLIVSPTYCSFKEGQLYSSSCKAERDIQQSRQARTLSWEM